MTAVAPPGSAPVTSTPGDPSAASLSWEGDKMFNIYIYDYCHKRGFRKTARELLQEAEIPVDSTPPINARQGLLFEWWSVFWVLFTAKANGNGTDDAMLYTQHQAHQAAIKANQSRAQTGQPPPLGAGQMPPRGVNGIGPPPRAFPPNGVLHNGIPVNGPPAGPSAFAGGPIGQPNGIMPGGPPPGIGAGQPFMPGRPPPMGGPPRPPNGGGPPFQSPTMAHSPPNPGQPPQHAPPMGQLPPRGGMHPPGQQGMNPGQQTPTPMYQNLTGQPPSRTSTPSGGLMPSPSMANRPPINDPRQDINAELAGIPPQVLLMIKSELGYAGKETQALSFPDKQRILMTFRQQRPKPGQPGPSPAAGPSMAPRRNNKRNSSTSPGEDPQQPDDGLSRTGSSPPGAKRMRRSPGDQPMPGGPMNYPQHPTQPPQQGPGPGGPGHQMGNNPMMRPMGGPMSFPPGQMPGQMGNMNMLGAGGMNPMVSASMSPQMHPQQGGMNAMPYRQAMHLPQHPNRMSGPMNAASPGSDPSFNPGGMPMPGPGGPQPGVPPQGGPPGQFPGNRLAGPPNAKQPMSMLPPPSPAKDQNGPKDIKPPNGMPEGSPSNQPLTGPNPPGTNPPTPGPSQGGPGNNLTSPPLIMNPTANSMNPVAMALPPPPAPGGDLFGADFMQNVAMEDFDVGLFRADGDINFERDFGQWFNPDDVGGMDLGKQ